jgi:hypothetical protein
MDSQQPNAPMEDAEEFDDEEIEVTRDELMNALQEVVRDLSDGLKGEDRETYMNADDLAQNEWFFAGVSDEDGQFAVTMWPAEGEEDMLRIDIGTENDVHNLASNTEQIGALTDDFIDAMSEDYDDEYDEDEDEEEDEDLEDEDEDFEEGEELEEEEEEEEYEEDEMDEGEDEVGRDGTAPKR